VRVQRQTFFQNVPLDFMVAAGQLKPPFQITMAANKSQASSGGHMTHLESLKSKLAEIADLKAAASVLAWDQQTYMPPGGAAARAEQLATLERLAHELFVTDAMGEWLAGAAQETSRMPYESTEASLVRVTARDFEKVRKVPPELVAAIARTTSQAIEVWVQARADSNFPLLLPLLQRVFELNRDLAQCLGYQDRIYDALLDQYEPGMTTRELNGLFARLKKGLIPLVRAIADQKPIIDATILRRYYSPEKQWALGMNIITRLGFDPEKGRQDKSVHPFTTSFSIRDVRITTRIDGHFLPAALLGTLHECGHALYEQGVDLALERTPLSNGTSLGIHESQSRLWENLVGRSRSFWKFVFPELQAIFPEPLAEVSWDTFYHAINCVEPSCIRVEADEVTYNLHILLRFELESALLEGQLRFEDLPGAWNEKMKEYLGIVPSTDAQGVLQDVHWASGLIGYFPTYMLGNLVSVQLFEQAQSQIPGLLGQIETGSFAELLAWLREHIHRHGRKFEPAELLKRALGQPVCAEPYLAYLWDKYSKIYSLSPNAE
jgi:carboxypeptidase Taq